MKVDEDRNNLKASLHFELTKKSEASNIRYVEIEHAIRQGIDESVQVNLPDEES